MTTQEFRNDKEGLLIGLAVPWWVEGKDNSLIGAMIDRARAVHLRLLIREVLRDRKLAEKKQAKKKNGVSTTLPQLADELGVSDRTVGNWNRGETEPNQRFILALATVLGRDVRDLTPNTLEWVARVTAYLTDSKIDPGVIPRPALIYAQHRLGVEIPRTGPFSLGTLFNAETIASKVIDPLRQIDKQLELTADDVQRFVMTTAQRLESILASCKCHRIMVRHRELASRYCGPAWDDQDRSV